MLYVLECWFLVVIQQSVHKRTERLLINLGIRLLCQYPYKWCCVVSQIFTWHLHQKNEKVRLGKGITSFNNLANKVCHEDNQVHELSIDHLLFHLLVRVILVIRIVASSFWPGARWFSPADFRGIDWVLGFGWLNVDQFLTGAEVWWLAIAVILRWVIRKRYRRGLTDIHVQTLVLIGTDRLRSIRALDCTSCVDIFLCLGKALQNCVVELGPFYSDRLEALDAFTLCVDAHPLENFLHGLDAVISKD